MTTQDQKLASEFNWDYWGIIGIIGIFEDYYGDYYWDY